MQGISYIIDQGPENSNWMWWISLGNINGKKQKKKILRTGGSSVIWDQRKKGTGRKFNLLLDMCPIEKQKKWEEREREGKGERKNEKSKLFLPLSCPLGFTMSLFIWPNT